LTRDADEGVLPTLCTGCETRKGPFASEQKQQEVWERAKEMATRLPQELRPRNCARATGKERMDVGYDVKDGLGHDEKQAGLRRKRGTRTSCKSTTSITHQRKQFTTFCKQKVVENNCGCLQNMIRPQHSMGDGYARRKCDNCWDGKSTRDTAECVLPTLCTGCETRKGPFASEKKHSDSESNLL
jgi:hypothetical protein